MATKLQGSMTIRFDSILSCLLQNILYCPFGLKCGHELCKICALRCAGMATALGDPVKLLANCPKQAKCPECQQQGMFEGIIYLNQVDQMVRERYACKSFSKTMALLEQNPTVVAC